MPGGFEVQLIFLGVHIMPWDNHSIDLLPVD